MTSWWCFTCVIAGIPIGDSFVAVALSIIGYSINDTIVVFDRIRENRRIHAKESLETIADLSVSQSMSRSSTRTSRSRSPWR
jgi:preprotein translocase subunit SecF